MTFYAMGLPPPEAGRAVTEPVVREAGCSRGAVEDAFHLIRFPRFC